MGFPAKTDSDDWRSLNIPQEYDNADVENLLDTLYNLDHRAGIGGTRITTLASKGNGRNYSLELENTGTISIADSNSGGNMGIQAGITTGNLFVGGNANLPSHSLSVGSHVWLGGRSKNVYFHNNVASYTFDNNINYVNAPWIAEDSDNLVSANNYTDSEVSTIKSELKQIAADSTDFADFKTRMSNW